MSDTDDADRLWQIGLRDDQVRDLMTILRNEKANLANARVGRNEREIAYDRVSELHDLVSNETGYPWS